MKPFTLKKHLFCMHIDMDSFNLNDKSSYQIMYARLEHRDEDLSFDQAPDTVPLVELKKKTTLNDRIILTLSSKDILSKESPGIEKMELDSIAKNAIPGIQLEHFYLQIGITQPSYLYVVRRESVDNLLSVLKEYGINPEKIYLSDLNLNSYFSEIIGDTSRNVLDQYRDDPLDIRWQFDNIELVGPENLVLASALQTSLNDIGCESLMPETVLQNKEEKDYQIMFNLALKVGVFTIFTILISAFILSSSIENQTADKRAIQEEVDVLQDMIRDLLKSNEGDEEFLLALQKTDGIKTSFILDRIASTVQDGITMNSLEINPPKKIKPQKKEEIEFEFNRVVIQGNSKNSTVLDKWIRELNGFVWLSASEITHFEYNKYTSRYDFYHFTKN
jgi:hypothetical protein